MSYPEYSFSTYQYNSSYNTTDQIKDKVSSYQLSSIIDEIQKAMKISERQLIHRYLSKCTGVSTRSVLRYDKGEIKRTSLALLIAARDLLDKYKRGEIVTLWRGIDERPVVLRIQFNKLIDNIVVGGIYPTRNDLLSTAERKLGLKKGRLARIYRNPGVQLVDKIYYDTIEALEFEAEYLPEKTYSIGERIRHHIFGVGIVVKKIEKDKIIIRFIDGLTRILRENLKEDPFRMKNYGNFEPIPEFNLYAI